MARAKPEEKSHRIHDEQTRSVLIAIIIAALSAFGFIFLTNQKPGSNKMRSCR